MFFISVWENVFLQGRVGQERLTTSAWISVLMFIMLLLATKLGFFEISKILTFDGVTLPLIDNVSCAQTAPTPSE